MIHIVLVPAPAPGEEPPPLLVQAMEVWRAGHLALYGHDDLTDSPAARTAAYAEQSNKTKLLTLALDGERPVGACYVGMPLRDNTTLVEGDLTVLPGADETAVVAALWQDLAPRLVDAGRRTFQAWSAHPIPGPGAATMVPATGVGAIPRDGTTAALSAIGLRLEQVERHSQLDVRAALERADELESAARERTEGYELLGWVGATPPGLLADMAEVNSHMATDVPIGDLQLEPEDWDAGRVTEAERMVAAMGRIRVTTVARHRASGRLVAYSQIDHPTDKPAVGYQEDTLVVAEHRGHRLGMLVKVANLRRLHEHLPHVERVHTWNAGENDHMLAINHALGFRDVTLEGGWQRTGLGDGA